jgi:hypothetical protein
VPRLASAKGQNAVCAARRHATEYLEIETDNSHREEIWLFISERGKPL